MNNNILVKHMIQLYDIAKKSGILQLEDFSNTKNKFYKMPIYSYCLQNVLAGEKIHSCLSLNRNRKDLIIIKGFEMIIDLHYSTNEVARILGALLKRPKHDYELLNFPRTSK